ncbi:unnamed protein product [Paramecium sonneborni]|uniref:Transmembrane protein n=1 Tax=Paramecium sonneborni TaxID=65129 RepID=A0A8S1LWK6_9CILI|nr:unnamed protein product [Paramecium sonneborni]
MKYLILFIHILYILFCIAVESKSNQINFMFKQRRKKLKKQKNNKIISKMKNQQFLVEEFGQEKILYLEKYYVNRSRSSTNIEFTGQKLKYQKIGDIGFENQIIQVGTLKSIKEGRSLIINCSISVYKKKKQKVLLQHSSQYYYSSLVGIVESFRLQ